MVTTEELLALAKKKSSRIGKQKAVAQKKQAVAKAKLAKQEQKAIAVWKAKKKAVSIRKAKVKTKAKVARSALWKKAKKVARKQKTAFRVKYKKAQRVARPVRRPMPPQLRAHFEKKKAMAMARQRTQQAPTMQQRPIRTVRDMQNARSIRHLLTPQEQQIVDGLDSSARKSAAIQFATRRMKATQAAQQVAAPRTRIQKDIMTGRERIVNEIPIEKWVR